MSRLFPEVGRVTVSRDASRVMRKSCMPHQLPARLFGKTTTEHGHGVHAPFHVTTRCGHTLQTFESLELAIEAAGSLGPDHYVVDRHGLQIWNPQRKLLRNEE